MSKLGVITLTRTLSLFRRLNESLGGVPAGDDALRIVVNNGQDPELLDYAYRSGWACLNPASNLSFSEGNNAAAKVALAQGCSHLLLINDDVIASPHFLSEVRESYDLATPILGFRITDQGAVNHDGVMMFRNPPYVGFPEHIGRGEPAIEPGHPLAVVPAVTFAVVLIEAGAWKNLGGLDEGYIYGWEDTDLCLRAIEKGAIIRVRRDISVEHHECGTRQRRGPNDQLNSDRFRRLWVPKIPDLLGRYRLANPGAEGVIDVLEEVPS